MPDKHVRLHEYRRSGPLRLDPREVEALRAASVTVTPIDGMSGRYELRPGSTVGVVRVGGRQFDITPKVGIRRLLYLLSWSVDESLWGLEEADYGADLTLLEVMAAAYARALDRALGRGVVRGYRTRDERGVAVRGRIDLATQVRREHGRLLPINITWDDHTVDTDANRLLLAALVRLRAVRLRQASTRRLLLRSLDRLEGVELVRVYPSRVPRVRTSRLDRHYRPALGLARIVLQATSIEMADHTAKADALLFDMNEVFEDFVVGALRDELGLDHRTFPQNDGRLRLAEDRQVRLRPDLSWIEGGRPIFVGDVKYKRLKLRGFEHPDLYQAHAYARAANLPSTLLVYAKGEEEARTFRVVNGGPEIEVATFDLEQDLEGLQAEVRRIAGRVRAHAAAGNAAAQRRSVSPMTTTVPAAG